MKLFLLLLCFSFSLISLAEECKTGESICVEGAETKTIDGIKVHRDCWRYKYSKECPVVTEGDCAEIPINECNLKSEECNTNISEAGKDYCAKVKKTYDCQTVVNYDEQKTELIIDPDNKDATKSLLCSAVCLDGSCDDAHKAKQENNNEMGDAVAQLQMLSEVRKGLVDKDHLQFDIFKGQDRRCSKKALSYSNCCNNSGWAKSIGIVSCRKEQVELAELNRVGKCRYVGEYCSTTFLGACVINTKTYCCYPNVLSKNIQEGARSQLGKNFGSPEYPECGGLTLQELERIDFSKIDFREFWDKEVASKLKSYGAQDNQNLINNSFPKLDKTGLNREALKDRE